MTLEAVFLALCGLSALASACGVWRLRRAGATAWLGALVAPFLACWSLGIAFHFFHNYWNPSWDTSRLLPSIALVRGLPVYSNLEAGSIQTTMYPPGWVLAYLPVALAGTPTGVLCLGYLLSPLYAFAPAFAFFRSVSGRLATGLAFFGLFLFLVARIEPLVVCFRPHADAPALGFGLLAALLLWRATRAAQAQQGLLMASALLCCLSVWTKQVMAPAIPALLLWCLAAGGYRLFLRFFLYALVSGGALGLVFVALFSLDALYLNIIAIPSRCPWQGAAWTILAQAAGELWRHAWRPGVILLVGGATQLALARDSWRQRVTRSAWPLLAVVALFLLPTSLLGRVKVGGFPNTLSPFLYFWLVGCCVLLLEGARIILERLHGRARGPAVALLGLVAIGCTAGWGWRTWEGVRDRAWPRLRANPAQQAYDYLRQTDKPETVLFPTLPLVHLLARDQVRHFSSSIFDREVLSRIPMSRSQKEATVPPEVERVYWLDPQWGTEYVEPVYFGAFSNRVDDPALPAFRCQTKAEPDAEHVE